MAEKKKSAKDKESVVGSAPPRTEPTPPKHPKKAKLLKTKTHRLPRKQKKAQQKLANAKAEPVINSEVRPVDRQ
jgi:hypothetical protein